MATWKAFVNLDLDLFWQKGGPDGNVREMIFMNNKFPGPELRIDQVHNNMSFNTTIHFHGIEQRNTPWSDGVQGLTQSISNQDIAGHIVGPPTQYGTYWYYLHALKLQVTIQTKNGT
ncbi:Multicopper oxidasetype 2 [Penicillium desertorum]|uniref:Multicopper oxidasetype 2 n=1 Tax=Penicillium desertorum TaxID=1303715 RepID=A0A9X0BJT7_9EURO|nr:Multicopper oxidasetype 2 [Penicillium desertorum]